MARITVEDCVEQVPNRFELVVLAAQRVKQLASGAAPILEVSNDKPPVLALREIAVHDQSDAIKPGDLKEAIVRGFRNYLDLEESDEEIIDTMDEEAGTE